MAFRNLILLEGEEVSDEEIMEKIALARKNNTDKITLYDKSGSKIEIHIEQNFNELEYGILD